MDQHPCFAEFLVIHVNPSTQWAIPYGQPNGTGANAAVIDIDDHHVRNANAFMWLRAIHMAVQKRS